MAFFFGALYSKTCMPMQFIREKVKWILRKPDWSSKQALLVTNPLTHSIAQTWKTTYRSDDFVPDTDAKCKHMLRNMPHYIRCCATSCGLNVAEPFDALDVHRSASSDEKIKREKRQLLLALIEPTYSKYRCTIKYVSWDEEVHSVLFTFLLNRLIELDRIELLVYRLEGLPYMLTATQTAILSAAKKHRVPFELWLHAPPSVISKYRDRGVCDESEDEDAVFSCLKMQSITKEIERVIHKDESTGSEPVVLEGALVWSRR